jgi:hypothetical protein
LAASRTRARAKREELLAAAAARALLNSEFHVENFA